MMKLIANIEKHDDQYVAWVETAKIKGLVVQAGSLKEVMNELLISLRIKLAYTLGIEMNSITAQELNSFEDFGAFKAMEEKKITKTKKEINFAVSY
jgi:hypothetical protein